MSTQDTAALVQSVNKMTETVAGKMGEIDKKVAKATDSVAKEVRSLSSFNFSVSNDGSDEDGNGTEVNPFKTIRKALAMSISGSMVNIRLKDNQEYICESSSHNNLCNNKDILIGAYGSSGIRPKLVFRMTQGSFSDRYVCNYFEGSVFSLTFSGIDIIHEQIQGDGVRYGSDSFGGVVTRGTSSSGGANITLRMSGCSVVTGDCPFVTAQMGNLSVHLNNTTITKGGESNNFLPGDGIKMGRVVCLQSTSLIGFDPGNPADVFQYDESKVASVLGAGI